VPSAGTYVLVGQQILWTAPSTVTTIVECYTANQAGTPLPYGAYSMTTVPAGGQNYVTVPLNGYFTTTGYTQINVNCRYYSNGTIATTSLGTITAASTD
jgi:hypothetical protein